jgi:hypothetical protein
MKRTFFLLVTGYAVACGGIAVIDPDDGEGGSGATTSVTTTSTSSTSTGPGACGPGNECPPNAVCILGTGQCALSCNAADFCETCPAGEICDSCATSSCPGCYDCVAACVPVTGDQCDDHDDCPADYLCQYTTGQCEPSCDASACADPNLVCADCFTSSCPCCDDCLSLCVSPP